MVKEIGQFLLDIAKEYGLFIALTVALLLFFGWMHIWMIKHMMKAKDEEIKRLVIERDKLQDYILGQSGIKRLSSEEEHK